MMKTQYTYLLLAKSVLCCFFFDFEWLERESLESDDDDHDEEDVLSSESDINKLDVFTH